MLVLLIVLLACACPGTSAALSGCCAGVVGLLLGFCFLVVEAGLVALAWLQV